MPRRRNRRQDIYDLNRLVAREEIDEELKAEILTALNAKCQQRGLEPSRESLDNPEIKRRSGTDWQSMKLELGELPDFEACFSRVSGFYRHLPW